MKTIKLTYVLEIEVSEDAFVTDGDALLTNMRRVLAENVHRGWRCSLRRLIGVDRDHEIRTS